MARRKESLSNRGGNNRGDFDLSDLGESLTIHHLAARVDGLQQQVDVLTHAFSMSVDLQRSLLQQLEDQTSQHSHMRLTEARPIFASTPAAHTLSSRDKHTDHSYDHSLEHDTQHTHPTPAPTLSMANQIHLPGLVPTKFDGGKSIDPEEWLQSVSLYKSTLRLSDAQFFLELTRFFENEFRKWYCAMQPHIVSWNHFSDLFRQAFLPIDNEEKIWRGILDRVQAPNESLPTFVAHLVTEFKRLKQPPSEQEQIEIISRHVSDQFRLALHAAAPTTMTDLLLTAHKLHAALGPVSFNRTTAIPLHRDLHCFKCLAPGVTTRNCDNCRKTKQAVSSESHVAVTSGLGQETTNNPDTSAHPRGDTGARPKRFQRAGESKGETETRA